MPQGLLQELLKELGKAAFQECVMQAGEIMFEKAIETMEEKQLAAGTYKPESMRVTHFFKVDINGVITKEYKYGA